VGASTVAAAAAAPAAAVDFSKLPQAPHSGHLPNHLGAWAPQDWHSNHVRCFGMGCFLSLRAAKPKGLLGGGLERVRPEKKASGKVKQGA